LKQRGGQNNYTTGISIKNTNNTISMEGLLSNNRNTDMID